MEAAVAFGAAARRSEVVAERKDGAVMLDAWLIRDDRVHHARNNCSLENKRLRFTIIDYYWLLLAIIGYY